MDAPVHTCDGTRATPSCPACLAAWKARCSSPEPKKRLKDLVCFAKSFSYENAPNITHMTLDGERTACGRTGWETTEGWHSNGPDCLTCRKAWDKLPAAEKRNTWEED